MVKLSCRDLQLLSGGSRVIPEEERREIWVLSSEMLNKLDGVHVGFQQQETGMKARRLGDKTWTKEGPERVLQTAGTEPLQDYMNKRQATVAEWVALCPIFEVCAKETGYE